jgi:hypothetical protein
MSATVGRAARKNDSVLPAQSWNSSQTKVGFSLSSMALAIFAPSDLGRARTEAMRPQKPRKSLRETPRLSSSLTNRLSE